MYKKLQLVLYVVHRIIRECGNTPELMIRIKTLLGNNQFINATYYVIKKKEYDYYTTYYNVSVIQIIV